MSMELHVLLSKSRLPDVQKWQSAIDALGFDVKLDPSLNVESVTGFLPVKLKGQDSGFEFDVCPAPDITESYTELSKEFGNAEIAANFRWGGDLNEMACALVASAALARLSDGIWFDPQEGVCLDSTEAIKQAESGMQYVE